MLLFYYIYTVKGNNNVNKIKKAICVLASMAMCLSLFGCNSDDNSKDDKESKKKIVQEEKHKLDKKATFDCLSFDVSSEWKENNNLEDNTYRWYEGDNDFIMLRFEDCPYSVFDTESFLESFELSVDEVIESEIVSMFGLDNVLKIEFVIEDTTIHTYIFLLNNKLYDFGFTAIDENGNSTEMSEYFPDVLKSVEITQPQTEPPTEQTGYILDETVEFDENISYSVSSDWVQENDGGTHQFFTDDFGVITFSDITNSDEYFSEKLLTAVVETLSEQKDIIGYRDATVAGVKAYIVEENDTTGYMFAANGRCYIIVFAKTMSQELIESVVNSIKISQTQSDAPESEESVAESKPESDSNATLGMKNALETAKGYIEYSEFSYLGLIEQLEFEGYSNEEATYGADNCGADWTEQALLSAISYIDYSSFSYQGLVEQLEYEKFTHEQAVYGADNCGADWNEQAALTAQSYLDYSSFSRQELLDQLLYEGFTAEQAEYGVTAVGY